METPLIIDSATRLGPDSAGRVVICGSHAGRYPAWLAARARVRAVVLNDAGVGKDGAGIAGLADLQALGIAACTVGHTSARIADGADTFAHGTLTHANEAAQALGCRPGMVCSEAVAHLRRAHATSAATQEHGEARTSIPNSGHRPVWAMDSASLVKTEHARSVVLCGSHGGLLGGKADDGILTADVFAVFLNDAGGGKDGAGFARLATLDPRGIAGATVSHDSARIGEGKSTYETGILSHVNETARRLGLIVGMSAREAVARLVGLA